MRSGIPIPKLGIGTWQMKDAERITEIFRQAFEAGYQLIDTASAYGNEIAISKALRALAIPRDKLFLQDKLWNSGRGYQEAQEACKKSLKKLKLDFLDAYLIHWPASPKLHTNWEEINAQAWRGLEKLKADGYVRTIGVCNFKVHHLEKLKKSAKEMPELNQIEFHPGFWPKELLDYCKKENIRIEASSPLGNGDILQDTVLNEIAKRYNKTPAQICLRWELEKEVLAIPKTEKLDRITQNRNIFDFSLTKEDTIVLNELPYCGGLGIDADEVTEFG